MSKFKEYLEAVQSKRELKERSPKKETVEIHWQSYDGETPKDQIKRLEKYTSDPNITPAQIELINGKIKELERRLK